MELFVQFASQQWLLLGVLSMLVALLLWHESRKAGPTVTPQQLSNLVNRHNAVVVDVRPPKEFHAGHVVDAINIPVDKLDKHIDQLGEDHSRPVVVVCKSGQQSGTATKALKEAGFDSIYRLAGGMIEWSNSQLPVVRE